MRIRYKTLGITAITLIVTIFFIYVAAQAILLQSYTNLEAQSVGKEVDSALHLIDYDHTTLDTVTVDYAYWDDTVSYMIDHNSNFVDSNFIDTMLLNQRLNVVVLADGSDSIVYAKCVNLTERKESRLPAGLLENCSAGSTLLRSSKDDHVSGILSLPDGSMMISAYPVKDGNGTGPSKGTVIMGRFLNDNEINKLKGIAGIQMSLVSLEDTPDMSGAERAPSGNEVMVMPVDSDTVSGYAIIRDVYGNPAAALRVDMPRTIYAQWHTSMFYIIAILFVIGFPVTFIGASLIDKFVISRIVRLSERISRIGTDNEFSGRLEDNGNDELSTFVTRINDALDALDRSRRQLQDSEQRLRNMIENINEVFWEMDASAKFTYVSPQNRDVFGSEPGEILGHSAFDLVNPDERERLRETIRDKIASTGSFTQVEFSIVRKDGVTAYIEVSGKPVLDPDGKITGYCGTVRDVTERRQAEEALHQSERRLSDIINHLPDATLAVDRDGKIIAWNRAIEEMTGMKTADMLGRGDREYAIPFYGDKRLTLINLIFRADEDLGQSHYINVRREGRALMAETTLPRPLGKNAVLWAKASPLYDEKGRVAGVVESIRDITDLRHVEAVLRENEARLYTIVRNSPLPLFAIDRNHRIIYWSKSLEDYSGIKAEDAVGTNHQWKPFYTEEKPCIADLLVDGSLDALDRRDHENYHRSSMYEEAFEVTGFYPAKGRWLHGIGIAIRDVDSNIVGAIEIFEDITEHKLAEDKIKASLAEKEVLLKEIHHRVKNNLQIISSLLSLQSGSFSGQDQAQMFRESQDRIRSMALIHEKLYQSRDLARVDFAEYVRSLTAYLSRSYKTNRGVEIAIDIEGIYLDIDRAIPCGLIINELVSNSLKYAFPEGQPGMIRISLFRDGDWYVMVVADNGIGLPPGFDIGKARTLGLQLVGTLISQLDGTIEMRSVQGTAIEMRFPDARRKPSTG